MVSAYDFEYAWKKILSPSFKTAFAYPFYPMKKCRRKPKEGKIPDDEIGITVVDDLTLKVELVHPTPYFLQWTAHPVYSPIHREIDTTSIPNGPINAQKIIDGTGPSN